MTSCSEIANKINGMPIADLRKADIFDFAEMLETLGMFADENNIGHPERPVADWTNEQLEAVIRLFKNWPKDKEFVSKMEEFKTKLSDEFCKQLNLEKPAPDRKKKLEIAVGVFSKCCRDILGFKDFPDIELTFEAGILPSYFGGLRPDGKIQICSRNILRDSVPESNFTSDLSFIELVFHESIHKLQSYMAEISDQQTPNENLNMLVANNFYEATNELRKRNREIYWEHPFESQARKVAQDICANIQQVTKSIAK